MLIFYSPRCLEYEFPHHPETPTRVRAAVTRLQKNPKHEWHEPTPATEEDILRVHTREQIEAVRAGKFRDADTPWSPAMFGLAILSAGSAINAAEAALSGRQAFSLMRPPGHHAERNRVMGFCYFNNIVIAVVKMLAVSAQRPAVTRIAIVDFDCHHGNGTQDIFLGDERVLFVSLHQSPCYPGSGLRSEKNCRNYPLLPGTSGDEFLAAFDRALNEVKAFKPELLAISAGFDAHKGDPITEMALEVETFGAVGERLRALEVPSFAVLEGGYGARFAACVEAFVDGWGLATDGH